nr:hypothetical protein CFP56_45994 [Quercus suber]
MVPTIPTIASKDPTDTFFRPSMFLRPPISSSSDHRFRISSSSDHRSPICPYPPRSVSTLPQNRTGAPFAVGLI